MKTSIWFFVLLLIPATACLQEENTLLEKDLTSYLAALEAENIDALLPYLYTHPESDPSGINTRQKLYRIFGDASFRISYAGSHYERTPKVIEFENSKYSTVFFTTQLSISPLKNQNPEVIHRILSDKFGQSNICQNSQTGTFTVRVYDCLYAIKSCQSATWKFYSGDAVIPQNVVDKFALGIINWMSNRI